MYMLREVCTAQRGKAREVVDAFRTLDNMLEQAGGYSSRRIYVDYAGPMDTVVYQVEMESLDAYFAMERAAFDDPQAKPLVDALNTNARSGYKEIYEVIQ
jgi:hypothetical protein